MCMCTHAGCQLTDAEEWEEGGKGGEGGTLYIFKNPTSQHIFLRSSHVFLHLPSKAKKTKHTTNP